MNYSPHIFSGNPLDRGHRERRDEKWLSEATRAHSSKFLVFYASKVALLEPLKNALVWVNTKVVNDLNIQTPPIFLGLLNKQAHFAINAEKSNIPIKTLCSKFNCSFEEIRQAAEKISKEEASIIAQAHSQLIWHQNAIYCSSCGSSTSVRQGGHMRLCDNCNMEHFPRTNPVMIVLVSNGDYCLLGQSHGRLANMNMYSALAGFIDQGESIEEAVAREVLEESGIEITDIKYHSSQPWPLPHSLMIGCHAVAVTTAIHKDEEEMIDVQWFHRDEILLALRNSSNLLSIPGPTAIAHHLIKSWALEK
jgi:NAD+ diphosphatase